MKIDNKIHICIALFCALMLSITSRLTAQEREWEIDKVEKRAQAKKQALDSGLVHLKNKWEVKVAHGRWYFALPRTDELAIFPKNMGAWEITGAWHFKERWLAELSVGFHLKRNIPARPNIAAVIAGEDFNIEGSGGAFVPISVGLKYYFTQKRFRPLIGISSGVAPVMFRYIFAEGNIINGVKRTENKFSDRTLFGNINTGFDYRLSEQFSFGVNADYNFSSSFSKSIGGYSKYQGVLVNAGIAVIF